MKIVKEHFDSINQMISAIESRPNNRPMNGQYSSRNGSKSFTLTASYGEAKKLFETGYVEILDQIKTGVSSNMKKTEVQQRRRIQTGVVGYAPHVPNAILGLPNSMILTAAQPQKIKAISLVIGIVENCTTSATEFVKSGIAALSVINTLELRGYRVNCKIAFYIAEARNEMAFGTVNVKDYREHLDLQKMCFPLAHPSMFRRIGFKWLETVPELTSSDWSFGYGHSISDVDTIQKKFLPENEYFINLSVTKKCGYDADEIIKYLGI